MRCAGEQEGQMADLLDTLKARLGGSRPTAASPAKVRGERVQKNLSIIAKDAHRLKGLARRDGLSQAQLIRLALDAYEARYGMFEGGAGD